MNSHQAVCGCVHMIALGLLFWQTSTMQIACRRIVTAIKYIVSFFICKELIYYLLTCNELSHIEVGRNILYVSEIAALVCAFNVVCWNSGPTSQMQTSSLRSVQS